VTPFAAKAGMSDEHVLESVEKYIRKYFGKRGEHVVQENLKCVREGLKNVMSIPWEVIANGAPAPKAKEEVVFAK
jgi:pyruvate-ferredoxin/flavodoxin oxidoreductase